MKKHLQFIQAFKGGGNLIEVDSKQQRTVSDTYKLEKRILKKENDIARAYRKLLREVNDTIKFSPLIRSIREVSYFYQYIYLEQSHLWSRSQNDRKGKDLFDEYYNACLQEHLEFISIIAQNIHSLYTTTCIPESADQDFYRLLFPADNLFQQQIWQIESKIDSVYIRTFSELKTLKDTSNTSSIADHFFLKLLPSYFGYKTFHKSGYDLLRELSDKQKNADINDFYMKNLENQLSYISLVNSNINFVYFKRPCGKKSKEDLLLESEIEDADDIADKKKYQDEIVQQTLKVQKKLEAITKDRRNRIELRTLAIFLDINDSYIDNGQTDLWAESCGDFQDILEAEFYFYSIFSSSRSNKYWTFALKMVTE